jgi:hypothetical protein
VVTPRGGHRKQVINPHNLFKTEDAALDMALGLDEPVERLLRWATLRTFVPPWMPPSSSPQEAYDAYVRMQPCMAKVRHELQAFVKARALASSVRAMGFRFLRDMLPFEEHQAALEAAGLDSMLQGMCRDALAQLASVTFISKYGKVRSVTLCLVAPSTRFAP